MFNNYEPSWLDIYMNAMANQPPMMPLSSFNQQIAPIDATIPQSPIEQPIQPDQNIMVDNKMNQTQPIDNSMSNLSDLSSNGVMNG